MTSLQWSRSHGDVETYSIPRQADPPAPGGVGNNSADADAADGGIGGFPIRPARKPEDIQNDGMNLWSLLIGQPASIYSEVADVLQDIDQQGITAGARLKALAELQSVLREQSVDIGWEDSISVPVGDLLLVLQMAMQRLG